MGCKSSTDETEAIPKEQLASTFAQAICDSFAGCCSSAHFTFDATNCKGAVTADLQKSFDESSSPKVVYGAAAAGECLAEAKKVLRCGSLDFGEDIAVCKKIFTGTVATGQACASSAECQSGYCSQAPSDPTDPTSVASQVCVSDSASGPAPKAGKAGDTCTGDCTSPDSCFAPPAPGTVDPSQPQPAEPTTPVVCYRSEGLYCATVELPVGSATPFTQQCKPLLDIGESCGFDESCKEGLFCAQTGNCAAPHPNGASCANNLECQSGYCDQNAMLCANFGVSQTECANGTRN